MNIKELLTSAGFEIPENADITGLETKLAKMYTPDGKQIPYERFQEKVKELGDTNAKLAEYETELNSYKTKIESYKTIQDELDSYKTKVTEIEQKEIATLRNRNKEILKKLKVSEDDKNYRKYSELSKKFIAKEKEEDYTREELAKNIDQFELLSSAGVFEVTTPDSPNTPPPGDGKTPSKIGGIADIFKQ
jgi:myosin heavy subunit